jgi:hypothetical protein
MRIAGFFLGFLFFGSAVSGYRVIAQDTPQPAASVTSQTDSTSGQIQSSQEPSSASAKKEKSEKNDSGSSGDRKLHLRLGAIALGAGYSHFSGPAYYPYGPYPLSPFGSEYSALWFPYWWNYPFFAPSYFAYGSDKGEVRLAAEPKTAGVYLDRAYAGTANHLRNIWLEPGAYDLSLAATGREDFHQRIYVLSGKSLKITANLMAAAPKPDEAAGQVKEKP